MDELANLAHDKDGLDLFHRSNRQTTGRLGDWTTGRLVKWVLVNWIPATWLVVNARLLKSSSVVNVSLHRASDVWAGVTGLPLWRP